MNLETEIYAVFVENVEDGLPPARLFGVTFLDEAGGTLRIRIEIGPGQRAGEGHVFGQPEAPTDERRLSHLIRRPVAALVRTAAQMLRALLIEHYVIGRVDRNHLTLEMGREFADRDADIGKLALHLVAIGGAFIGAVEIEEAGVGSRNLDGLVAIALGPSRNTLEGVVRRRVARKLRQ